MKTEYIVCPASEIAPGTHAVLQVGNRKIGVFNVGGEYFALPNTCFHQNGPLCRGIVTGTIQADGDSDWRPEWRFDGEIVVCPWHSLEFHVRTGQCIAYPNRCLPTYRVTVEDGMLRVTL